MKSPQQAAYDWTFKTSSGFVDTYDHLPMKSENAAYPFVVIEENVITHTHTKSSVGAVISQTIDVWGDSSMRLMVSSLADQIMHAAGHVIDAYGYHLDGRKWHHTAQMTQDQSVPNVILNRAQVTLIFELS